MIKIKKLLKKIKIHFLKYIRDTFPESRKVRLPKNISNQQTHAFRIFFKILKKEKTDLLYDLLTNECYLISELDNVYIFIEDKNMKIVNTVYSHDVPLNPEVEKYILKKFELELNKRRGIFKNQIISKTNYHLSEIYTKIS